MIRKEKQNESKRDSGSHRNDRDDPDWTRLQSNLDGCTCWLAVARQHCPMKTMTMLM